jgi:hypothetical protein
MVGCAFEDPCLVPICYDARVTVAYVLDSGGGCTRPSERNERRGTTGLKCLGERSVRCRSGLSNFEQLAKVLKPKYCGSLLLEDVQVLDATSRYGEFRLNSRLKEIWRSRSRSNFDARQEFSSTYNSVNHNGYRRRQFSTLISEG